MNNQKDDRLKNIRKIRDGVYEIQISNGTRDDGSRDRITETVYGTEDDAVERKKQIKAELEEQKKNGIKVSNGGYTFLEVAKMFLEDRDYSKKVGTTISGYKGILNNYVLPEFADKKIRNIKEEDLQKLYKKMSETISKSTGEFLSGTTIKHTHTLIGTIFNYAIFKKWISYNPATFVVNAPTFDTKEREYYDHEEIKYALSCLNKMEEHKNGISDRIIHSQNLRFKTAITLLFNSGLRREELFGLKWKDLKFNCFKISIKRAVVQGDPDAFDPEDIIEILPNGLICKELKNDASRRDLFVPTVCFDLLTEYRKDQLKLGYPCSDEDYVFQNVRSTGIWNPNYLTKEWSNFIEQFNLKKITVHDIRHSHATDLLSMGVPIQDVSRRLGHSDIATTLKIYTHSNLEQDKLIVQKLEESYGNYYVAAILNFKVIVSIITGIKLVEDKEIDNAIHYITGEEINNINKNMLLNSCKKYILSEYNYLENVNLFINDSTSSNMIEAFIDIMSNISNDINNLRPIGA